MAENDIFTRNTNSPSDDSDHDTNCTVPELKGYLSKWTNYIHGWQPRFIVLKDGTLSYYKRQALTRRAEQIKSVHPNGCSVVCSLI